jgi:dihydrofolate synthase/folylpolyglutamate synthase
VLDRLFALETFGIKLGLEKITSLCEALGHPERTFTTLHVAGTNGKGSVTAMAHAGLVAAGLRAARYTSPHLADLRERFVIGDRPVEHEELLQVASQVVPLAERLTATFFEATTAIGFELFRQAGVDVAVIEVGLGGRFDATNVVAPRAGAITSIGLDHQQHLGTTLAAIAREKAGIIKPGTTIVVGDMPAEASRVIAEVATARGARLVPASAGATVDAVMADGRAALTIDTPADRYGPLTLALRGAHQIGNALVAVRLLEAARDAGLLVPGEAIERGLSTVVWPARLELLHVEGRRVLLDAAHNVDGARALAAYLERWHPERPALVVGVMHDKDVEEILAVLLPLTSHVVATQAATPRALPAAELRQRVLALDPVRQVEEDANPVTAVDRALRAAPSVCVAGSIFVAGAVRDGLVARAATTPRPAAP